MTVQELLRSADIAPLDAAVLLSSVLTCPRSWLLAHENEEVAVEKQKEFEKLLARRKAGEPAAYILKKKEFFGREFLVDSRVLIPRPATERLVEIALDVLQNPRDLTEEIDTAIVAFVRFFKRGEWGTLVDIGSGSGCISITLALEFGMHRGLKSRSETNGEIVAPALSAHVFDSTPSTRVFDPRWNIIGVDSSKDALEVAKENQKKLGAVNIEWVQQDGIKFVKAMTEPFVLISNPPYIPEGTVLEPTVSKYEPNLALFAGKEGMDVITPLLKAANENPQCKGVIMEMRAEQVMKL